MTQQSESGRKRVAVFFGGRSPEHDVSIVTGHQVMQALRHDKYEVVPVYVSLSGQWLTGDRLLDRNFYIPSSQSRRDLVRVSLGASDEGFGQLRPAHSVLWRRAKPIQFDVAVLAFHGAIGEDGCFQGILESENLAYTGMRHLASAIAMDKAMTKVLVQSKTTASQLPALTVRKQGGTPIYAPDLPQDWNYPVIVKPAHMGSSIGVAKATNRDEVEEILRMIFVYDNKAIIEPFIAHRREYNIAVRRSASGAVQLSAIEMPKSQTELLDFKEKYLGSSGPKKGLESSEGMLSLTRDINPQLEDELRANLNRWATEIFEAFDGTGTPRLDFILDETTGKVWFNEINPCPGSFAYFLWEAAHETVLFSDLLDQLIDEALYLRDLTTMPSDPVPAAARLFKRQ